MAEMRLHANKNISFIHQTNKKMLRFARYYYKYIIYVLWIVLFVFTLKWERQDLSQSCGQRVPSTEKDHKYRGYGYGVAWAGSEYDPEEEENDKISFMERLNRMKVGVTFFFRSVLWRRAVLVGTIVALILSIVHDYVRSSLIFTIVCFFLIAIAVYYTTSYYYTHENLPASSHVLKHIDQMVSDLYIERDKNEWNSYFDQEDKTAFEEKIASRMRDLEKEPSTDSEDETTDDAVNDTPINSDVEK